MKTMKILITAAILATLFSFPATAHPNSDAVGLGLALSHDFQDLPDREEIRDSFLHSDEVIPGFLVFFRDDNWGMSFDFGFNFYPNESTIPDVPEEWWMDFAFTAGSDWHLMPARFPIDPFVEISAGMGMRVDITDYEEYGYKEDDSPYGHDGLTHMSFHTATAAGVNFNLGGVYLQGKLEYRLIQSQLPIPGVAPYSTRPFRILLSAGMYMR